MGNHDPEFLGLFARSSRHHDFKITAQGKRLVRKSLSM